MSTAPALLATMPSSEPSRKSTFPKDKENSPNTAKSQQGKNEKKKRNEATKTNFSTQKSPKQFRKPIHEVHDKLPVSFGFVKYFSMISFFSSTFLFHFLPSFLLLLFLKLYFTHHIFRLLHFLVDLLHFDFESSLLVKKERERERN